MLTRRGLLGELAGFPVAGLRVERAIGPTDLVVIEMDRRVDADEYDSLMVALRHVLPQGSRFVVCDVRTKLRVERGIATVVPGEPGTVAKVDRV